MVQPRAFELLKGFLRRHWSDERRAEVMGAACEKGRQHPGHPRQLTGVPGGDGAQPCPYCVKVPVLSTPWCSDTGSGAQSDPARSSPWGTPGSFRGVNPLYGPGTGCIEGSVGGLRWSSTPFVVSSGRYRDKRGAVTPHTTPGCAGLTRSAAYDANIEGVAVPHGLPGGEDTELTLDRGVGRSFPPRNCP